MFDNKQSTSGSIIEPSTGPAFAPAAPGRAPQNTGASLASASQRMAIRQQDKRTGTLIETLFLIVVAIFAVIFVGLYIGKTVEYQNLSADVNGQIDAAVAMAVADNTTKMELEFAEREKFPYRNFMGPADYGSVSFQYPQTWSLYIQQDAAQGGDYLAYFNPIEVGPLDGESITALTFTIQNVQFESVVGSYDSLVQGGTLQFVTRNIGGVTAHVYSGTLPDNHRGAVAILKIRDKTVFIQTNAELFIDDFYKLLDTVTLIQ